MSDFEQFHPGEPGYTTEGCNAIDHNDPVIRLTNGKLVLVGGGWRGCSNTNCFKHRGYNGESSTSERESAEGQERSDATEASTRNRAREA